MRWNAYGSSPETNAAWFRFCDRWAGLKREGRAAWSRASIKRLVPLAVEAGLIEAPGTTHGELVSFGRLLASHASRSLGGWRIGRAAKHAGGGWRWDVVRPARLPVEALPTTPPAPEAPWLLEGVARAQRPGRPVRPPSGWVEGWSHAPARGRVPTTLADELARGARVERVDPVRVVPSGVLVLGRPERRARG